MTDVLQEDGSRHDFESLANASQSTLEAVMCAGVAPEFVDIAGWEFLGANTAPVTKALGLRKFKKGFYEGPPRSKSGPEPFIQGYNVVVKQNKLSEPYEPKPSEEHPKRHGFYRVHKVIEGAWYSHYDNALLLNYRLGGNGVDISVPLRDYLVQVYADDKDLLLGKAYFNIAGMPVYLSHFVLKRNNEHTFKG